MTITKRHYETIAKAVRETINEDLAAFTPGIAATRVDATRAVAEKLALVFERDNPRFHRSRFLDACGFMVDYTDPPAAPWQGDPTLGGRRERKRRAYMPSWQRETQG